MQFGKPNYFWLFGLLTLLALLYLLMFRQRRRLLERFANPTLLPSLLSGVSPTRQRIKPVLIFLSLTGLILALAEPKWGFRIEEVKRMGLDLVLALDVSKSMLAQDVKPSRLERAKLEIGNLLNTLGGDRVGLVAFAGSAFLQCPLTLDYATVKLFLEDLNITSIPRGGTNLGAAIHQAVQAFEGEGGGKRVVILVTDGEDHGKELGHALEEAAKAKVTIYAVGIGRSEGAPLPLAEEKGERRYLRDREGDIVLSRLNATLLEETARATGGTGGTIGSGGFSLEDLYQHEIAKLEKRELGSQTKKEYHHRFQWPLALATFFLYLEGLLSERK